MTSSQRDQSLTTISREKPAAAAASYYERHFLPRNLKCTKRKKKFKKPKSWLSDSSTKIIKSRHDGDFCRTKKRLKSSNELLRSKQNSIIRVSSTNQIGWILPKVLFNIPFPPDEIMYVHGTCAMIYYTKHRDYPIRNRE